MALGVSVSLSNAQTKSFNLECFLWPVPSVMIILDLARSFRSASLLIASLPGVPGTGR